MAKIKAERWAVKDGKIVVSSPLVPFFKTSKKWIRKGPVFSSGQGFVIFHGFRSKGQDFTRIDGTRKIQVSVDGRMFVLPVVVTQYSDGFNSEWEGECVFLPKVNFRPVFPLHIERWKDHAERAVLRDTLVARGLLPGVSDSELRKALQWPRETDVGLAAARGFLKSVFMPLPWNEEAFAAMCDCVDVP